MISAVFSTLFSSCPADYHAVLETLAARDAAVQIDCSGQKRLPVAFIATAVAVALKTTARFSLTQLPERVRLALTVLDGAGLPVDGDGKLPSVFSDEPPFFARIAESGELRLVARRGIGQHPMLSVPITYEWIGGLDMTSLIIDIAAAEHVNSVMVSWLLQICQQAKPIKPQLINASPTAVVQLARLRLDHVVDLNS